MDYKELYDEWLNSEKLSEKMKKELWDMRDNEKLIEECFYRELTFGTGGIRAIMGPGPNRLNIYTIRKNTEGYARYIEAQGEEARSQGVVIAYDNRNNSKEFAQEAAKVLATHGIAVYLFCDLRTTPELSFAVRYYKAFGGIVITASHNPPEYNGYKIYDRYGCQCVPRDTDVIIEYIKNVKDILDIEVVDDMSGITIVGISNDEGVAMPETGISCGSYGSDEIINGVDEAYYAKLLTVQENPDMEKKIKLVYTPLHGTGNVPVRTMLSRLGYNFSVVNEQCTPDGNFSNTRSPNPENKKSFERAITLAKSEDADLIIATDPDCDRIGLVVKHKDAYEYLTGNQTGAILLQYLLSQKKEKGTLPTNGIVFNTIVTSDLGTRICERYGVEVESTLTGFKFIGDKIREYGDSKTYLFGYEESYGYMIKDFTRDKDGVQAAILAAEAANYYYLQGKTLVDVLNEIYDEFGYCEDVQESETLPGIEGQRKMNDMVDEYRYGVIDSLEGRRVVAKEDYKLSLRYEADGSTSPLTLPKSNVIKLFLEDGSWVVVRPSGNEPKIKYYKNLWKNS